MQNQEQTVTGKHVICKVELFDFLMTLHSLVNSMTAALLSTDEKGGDNDAAENT